MARPVMAEVGFWIVAILGLAVTGTSTGLWLHNVMDLRRAEHRRG